jgi:predicted ferric reductase
MSEQALTLPRSAATGVSRRVAAGSLIWAVLLGNAAVIVWLWIHGGNLTTRSSGDVLTSVARITGLLAAYLALVQVVLLARLPVLERLVGFDRLSVWHRWNGHACVDLVIAHVVFSVWGYALLDKISLPKEISTMLGGGIYPGMITATIGTAPLLAVVATSIVIVRRRLPYEWWYAVHLLAYAGIALGWFHQIPTGNELVLSTVASDYWRGLYVATIAVLVVFRVLLRRRPRFGTGCGLQASWRRVPEWSRSGSRVGDSIGCRRGRGTSSSGGSLHRVSGGAPTRSRSRSFRTAGRFGSP